MRIKTIRLRCNQCNAGFVLGKSGMIAQLGQVAMLKSALEVGCRRFWKCGKCGEVQEYTYPMGETARVLLILSILTPLLPVAWLFPYEFFGPWLRSGFSLLGAVLAVFLGYFVLSDKIDEWLFYR